MSCYMRHMHWLFEALDLTYDKDNRKLLDSGIRQVLDLDETQTCSQVWAALKGLSANERIVLTGHLSDVLDAE